MPTEVWLSLGFLLTGIASWVTQFVVALFKKANDSDALTLSRLTAVVEAQGSWINDQAEQIVALKSTADALQVRVVATERHAQACESELTALRTWLGTQGMTPPP